MTKPTGKPRGRPKGEEYPARLHVQVTLDQHRGLLAYAKKQGMSASEIVRKLIEKALKRA